VEDGGGVSEEGQIDEPRSEDGAAPVAALDLGSNSFHLIIARVIGGQLGVVDKLRDPVRMAAGLDKNNQISEEALGRVLESLGRFRQYLHDIPDERVRAIGTNAFRKAKNSNRVLEQASDALGYPIEVLSGAEEARLIYLGVAHDRPRSDGGRLVIDIGGGSTECILGRGFATIFTDSLHMGCVSFSRRFFPEGKLSRRAFRKAEIAARLEFETLEERYRRRGWTECIGSSGTINALAEILAETGDGEITLSALKQIRRLMLDAESIAKLDLPGMQNDRREVLAGGLAILKAAFESMEIRSMHASKAALREGVVYDLLGRINQEDVRDRTIRMLSERYHIDQDHAERVERTALYCFDQLGGTWKLDPIRDAQLLAWAARTHEIGLALAYSGHQKHGHYILRNSDMPGFSRQEQERLSMIVRGHRGKLSRLDFSEFDSGWRKRLLRLILILRIATRLHRTRSPEALPFFRISAKAGTLSIALPAEWLGEHPLTWSDLEEEAARLDGSGYQLKVATS